MRHMFRSARSLQLAAKTGFCFSSCFFGLRRLRMTSAVTGKLEPLLQIPSLWTGRPTSHNDHRSIYGGKLGATSVVFSVRCGTQFTAEGTVCEMQPMAIFRLQPKSELVVLGSILVHSEIGTRPAFTLVENLVTHTQD